MAITRINLSLGFLVAALALGCGGKSEGDLIASAKQFMAKAEYSAAAVELKLALQQSPSSAEARFLLGVVLLEQGNNSAAMVELGKARDQNFNEELLAPKLARGWLATGKFKEIAQAYDGTTLKIASSQAELSTAVALAHARLNQRAKAGAAIAEALKADPKYPWALVTKARLVAGSGKVDEALALVNQAITPGSPSGDAFFMRGELLRAGKNDLDGAIKAYQQASADPKVELAARTALIQIYLSRRRLAEARAQLAELQKSFPKNPQSHYLDALVAYAGKDYSHAESVTEQLLRVAPNSPPLLVLAGAANLQQGALLAAESKLGKVVQTVEGSTVARKILAETYLRMGQPEKALAALRPILERAEPDGEALALAGQAQLQAGNAREAEAMFAAAAKLKPKDMQVLTALALTDLVKGKAEVAFDALQDIAARDPGETADLALISAHLGRHEYDAALAATALLERKLPTKPTAAYLRGLALRGKGDAAGARVAFEAALKIEPGHFASVASLVSLDLQEDKPDAAQQRLQAAIKLNPKNISARMAMVDLMVRQKAEPKVLLSAIDEAIKIAPADAAPHVAKIAQLSRMNDVKAAVSAAQNAMASLPQDPDVLQAAGRAMSNAGDEQQALSAFTRLAAAAPRSALPHLLLADVHAKLGDVAAAAFSLNRAFDTEPQSAEVHRRLLARASRTKNFKPVLAAAKELQKRFPQSAAGFLLEGDAEAARKDGPAALAAYRGSLKKADTLGIPQKQVFLTLRLSSDTAGAERFAVDWLKANPKDAGFRALLGGEAILRKDYSSAERYFRQVLVLQPDNGAAMNNLAWLMAERGANGAVALAENALKLAPGAAQVMDTLAKALAAEGYFARAIDIQKKALSVMPDYHEYRLNLARLYLKAGKRTEAGAELATLARLGGKFAFQVEVAEMRRALGD